jgi:hypothetical protein
MGRKLGTAHAILEFVDIQSHLSDTPPLVVWEVNIDLTSMG